MTAGHAPDLRLLVMCTANQCRSPMAAAIAAAHLEEKGVDAVVASCGSMEGGAPATRGAVRALRRRNLDLTGHVSHQVDLETLDAADLVITMERQHLTTVAELSLSAVDRSFTLRELSDLVRTVGSRPPELPLGEWVQRLSAMRHPTSVLSHSTEDDVEDPMGGPARAYRRTAEELEGLLLPVLDAAFPDEPTPNGP